MAVMHGRKLFTGIIYVRGFFIVDVAPVHEIEHPFRKCRFALYVRIWYNLAVVIGIWDKGHPDIQKHLISALGGRVVDTEEKATLFRSGGRVLSQSEEEAEEII
jgi:hypothetical protein